MSAKRLVLAGAAFVIWALTANGVTAHPGSGIAVDDQGRVFFTDTARGVWRIDHGGKLTLISPSAMHFMAIDREGRFADAPDEFGEWFGRLTPKGEKPTLISCSDFPCVVATDGNLYFAKMHGLTIVRRTPEGKESVLISRDKFGIDAARPVGVPGMACGPDGTIYLFSLHDDSRDHIVYAVDANGSFRVFAKNFVTDKIPKSERHPESQPDYCRGMAVDAEGNVYVAVTGNRCVMKLTPDGERSVILRTEKPWTPTGVDVADGEVFVLEYDDETPTEGRNWPLRIRKVSRDGTVTIAASIDREDS